jgi:hypothetical protein
MPFKSVLSGQMKDLHSVVAFFHRAKWSELAVGHEINHALEENTISYSTAGKYVRMFVISMKETDTPSIPELEGDFNLDERIALAPLEESFLLVR